MSKSSSTEKFTEKEKQSRDDAEKANKRKLDIDLLSISTPLTHDLFSDKNLIQDNNIHYGEPRK